jgi:phosphate transport system substrate-binding protein
VKSRPIVRRFALLIAALIGLAKVASADTLRIGGTGAATAMLPELFVAFDRGEEIKLTIIPSLGSNGGLRALEDGVLDIAVSGRSLTPEELGRGLSQAATIRTPFALVTSHPRPNGLKSAAIADIFKSPKAAWADGSPIRIILRPKSDSDTPVLGGMLPGMAAAIEEARRRPDIPIAATDQDNADLAERVPGSLAASTLTQIKMERRNLRFVAIDGVEPSLENFQNGAYPFGKTLYFVLPAKKAPAAERFIAFVRSPAGQSALHAIGNLLILD